MCPVDIGSDSKPCSGGGPLVGTFLIPERLCVHQDPLEYKTLHLGEPSTNLTIGVNDTAQCGLSFTERRAYSLFLYPGAPGVGVECDLVSVNGEPSPLSWTLMGVEPSGMNH